MPVVDRSPAVAPTDAVPIDDAMLAAVGWTILGTTAVAVVGVDAHGLVRLFNSGAEQLFERSAAETLARPLAGLLPDDAVSPGSSPTEQASRQPATAQRGRLRRRDGTCIDVELTSATLAPGLPLARLVLVTEAGARPAGTRELRHLAYHDSVTDLPNRAYLMARLRDAMARADANDTRLALLFIDFDRFKQVNDTLGHQRGDEVLRILGQRLTAAVRPRDLVARHGGDEFIVLMEALRTPATATRVASRILHALHEPVRAAQRQFGISVSIGIALYPDLDTEPAALLQRADSAMYSVKRSGGDAFRCAPPG